MAGRRSFDEIELSLYCELTLPSFLHDLREQLLIFRMRPPAACARINECPPGKPSMLLQTPTTSFRLKLGVSCFPFIVSRIRIFRIASLKVDGASTKVD